MISATSTRSPEALRPRTGHRLRAVSIVGGFLDGSHFEFTEGLNCIIGARGAGKTTVVELLRFALDTLPSRESHPQERRRIESLVERNLAGGHVKVTIETKDGLTYVVSRAPGEDPIVLTATGEATTMTLKAGGLFRADVFSQNEVEGIADRAPSQLGLLDNFEAERIASAHAVIANLRAKLAANASQVIPLQKHIAAIGEELGTLSGVEDRLKLFSSGTDASADLINQAHALKGQRDREKRASDQVFQDLANAHLKLKAQSGVLGGPCNADREVLSGANAEILQTIGEELAQCGRDTDGLLDRITQRIAAATLRVDVLREQLAQAHSEQELTFRALLEKHEHARGEAAERAQLERRRNELQSKKRTRQQLEESLTALQNARDHMLAELAVRYDQRYALRSSVATHINAQLGPAIQVHVAQFGNRERYQRLVEEGLKGARLKHVVVAQRIANAFWPTELASVVRDQNINALTSRADISEEQAEKVISALLDSHLLYELETVELLDLTRIELKDGDSYKDSLTLSTGQKCTAILPILLLDSDNPLIVDQPEDNLDNRFIFEAIVESIRRIKQYRQLVFVTHNPNIPVLGDAERVFVLDSNGKKSRTANQGTVDDVKPDIVTLLEGGEDAFKARKCRYAY